MAKANTNAGTLASNVGNQAKIAFAREVRKIHCTTPHVAISPRIRVPTDEDVVGTMAGVDTTRIHSAAAQRLGRRGSLGSTDAGHRPSETIVRHLAGTFGSREYFEQP